MNNDEYKNPLIYDAEYGGYQGDFDLFLNIIDQGNVLDLACGTGRLTIPMATKGLNVTGLEISEPMLKRAEEKAVGLDIKWVQGDITNFNLDDRFDLITLAGNSFQALLNPEDQLSLFKGAKAHLRPTGLFAFDTRNPQPSELRSTDDFEYWHSFQDLSGELVEVYGKQAFDLEHQIVTYTTKRIWLNHESNTTVVLRYTHLSDLLSLLDESGFKALSVYGDYQKSQHKPDSLSIVMICGVTD